MADLLVSREQEKISKWYTGKYIKSKLLDEAYEAIDFFPELGNQGKWLRFTAAIIRNAAGESDWRDRNAGRYYPAKKSEGGVAEGARRAGRARPGQNGGTGPGQ